VIDLAPDRPVLIAARTTPWDALLRNRILEILNDPTRVSIATLGELDAALGDAFADAALAVTQAAGLKPAQISGLGSHGQTLFHAPSASPAFTFQAGDASRIAARTGITTVADFRRRDIAEGGQGAPLVPAFHQAVFASPGVSRAILNIGGIANLTLLPADSRPVTGFDTGPGNVLLDAWIARHRGETFDRDGAWAAAGTCQPLLLEELLRQPYFSLPPPKSTGRELFNLNWLEQTLTPSFERLSAGDIQATLAELTVVTVATALERFAPPVDELFVCGGGALNGYLMQRLGARLPTCRIASTEVLGLHPDWVEGAAFAWLARQALDGKPGNLPSVTGARRAAILGAIHRA
jgi:anhydro-N-acetylmuramic acid kinase